MRGCRFVALETSARACCKTWIEARSIAEALRETASGAPTPLDSRVGARWSVFHDSPTRESMWRYAAVDGGIVTLHEGARGFSGIRAHYRAVAESSEAVHESAVT